MKNIFGRYRRKKVNSTLMRIKEDRKSIDFPIKYDVVMLVVGQWLR